MHEPVEGHVYPWGDDEAEDELSSSHEQVGSHRVSYDVVIWKHVSVWLRAICRIVGWVNSIGEQTITEKSTNRIECINSLAIEEAASEATVFVEVLVALVADSAGAVPASVLESVDVSEGEGAESQELIEEQEAVDAGDHVKFGYCRDQNEEGPNHLYHVVREKEAQDDEESSSDVDPMSLILEVVASSGAPARVVFFDVE